MKVYISCRYNSSKSKYKGRGFHQLTGKQDDTGLYNEPGPYEKYAEFVENKKIVEQPDLICTQIHYAIDSAGWFWTNKESGKTVPNWSSSSQKEYIKFRAEHFSKALGKPLNEVSHLVEEDEKYYWLQAKLLNGYPKGQKLETNPIGWNIREKAFKILKNEVFEFDKLCKGDKELEFSIKERAPWMDTVVNEAKVYGGKKQLLIQERVSLYHRKGANYNGIKDAWCSSFACWCLENTTPPFQTPHSAASSSFINHKTVERCEAFFGAIATFSDCDKNGNIESTGHVTFVYGKLPGSKIYAVLGGNQNNMIKVSIYDCNGNVFYSHYSVKRKKHVYKKFRGFFKPKNYVIKSEELLTDSDNYNTVDDANKKIGLGLIKTSTGEKDD